MKDFGLSRALGMIKTLPPTGIVKMTASTGGDIPAPDSDMQDSIMEKIVSPMIPTRSVHMTPLIKRVRIIVKPKTMSPGVFGKLNPLFAQLYAMYQKERADRMVNGTTTLGINKFASSFDADISFEKVAKYGKMKALTIGTPLIYAYSKYQRARIDNGEDISSPNRFIAEYPEAVAGLNVAFAPTIYKDIKKKVKNIGKSDTVQEAMKKLKFKKHANVAEELLYLDHNGCTDAVDGVLNKIASSRDDLEEYLAFKVAEQMEDLNSSIEKRAEEMLNSKEVCASSDAFIDTMAIAKILTEKL